MKHSNYIGALATANATQKFLVFIFTVSLLINLGLTFILITKKERVTSTFIPPTLSQPFVLSDGSYSNSYVEQVATWFISQTLNYHPSNYKYQISTFLKHVDPALFERLRQILLDEFEIIKSQRRSSTFFVQTVKVSGLQAVVTGIRQIKVGNTEATTEQEYWYLKLTKRQDGLVTLADFKQTDEKTSKAFVAKR